MGDAHEAGHAVRHAGGGVRRQQVRHRRVLRRGLADVTRLYRITVQGDDLDPWLGREELSRVRHPLGRAGGGPRERTGQHLRERGEVTDERVEVVTGRAALHALPVARHIPAEGGIELGLVARLERLDRRLSEPLLERAGLGRSEATAVGLEVDPHDQPRVQTAGQGVHDRHPLRGQRHPDPAGLAHAGGWDPRPVAAVAADPEIRGLPRVQVADQLEEQGIDGVPVSAERRAGSRCSRRRIPRKPGAIAWPVARFWETLITAALWGSAAAGLEAAAREVWVALEPAQPASAKARAMRSRRPRVSARIDLDFAKSGGGWGR